MNIKVNRVDNKFTFYEIDTTDNFKVTLCEMGASIYKIEFNGELMNITPANLEDFYKSKSYFGKTVGPTSGRIKDAKISIDDIVYELDKNEGNNNIHGGVKGLSFTPMKADVYKDEEKIEVTFRLRRHHLEGGFPGESKIFIKYSFYAGKTEFDITYRAVSDRKTPINLTNHTYFNLGERDVKNLTLFVKARCVMGMDDELIVNEKERCSPALDFTVPKKIGKDINDPSLKGPKLDGYDHHFVFDYGTKKEPVTILESDKYKLSVVTTHEEVTIYTDNFPSNVPLLNGYDEVKNSGVTLEFANCRNQINEPANIYSETSKFVFSTKGN